MLDKPFIIDEIEEQKKKNIINVQSFFANISIHQKDVSFRWGFPNDKHPPFIPIDCNECLHSYPPKHTDYLVCWKETEGIKNPTPGRDC